MQTVYDREALKLKEERMEFSINNARTISYCVRKMKLDLCTIHNFRLD